MTSRSRLTSPNAQCTKIQFSSHPGTLSISCKNKYNNAKDISFRALVETKCPSLYTPFQPPWWLSNGHSQTIYNIAGGFARIDQVWYRRRLIRLADGGTIGLDFTPPDFSIFGDDVPVIVVSHGLTGGSHEPYLRAVLSSVCKPVREGGLGYRAVVVTFRGCAGVHVTSPRLFTAGHTDDLRQAMMYIAIKYPHAPLHGLGFSMGANIMTRYVAEEKENSRLLSVAVLSCPWDLETNGHSLVRTFLGKNIYARGMGINLLTLVKRHEKSLRKFPDHKICQELPSVLALQIPTLPKFDDTFTRKIGGELPTFPIPTVDEYYRWASSHRDVGDIKVPFLSINSKDDPVVTCLPEVGENNGLLAMVTTNRGGHLGWFQSSTERWTTKPLLEWLHMMCKEVVHNNVARGQLLYKDEQHFIREEGRDNLGCMELEGGELIDGNAGEHRLRLSSDHGRISAHLE